MKWKLFTGWRYCLFFCLLLSVISACTLPSGGYYSRMEDKAENMLNVARKNEKNTKLLAENTTDENKKAKWRKEYTEIPDPVKTPKDKNSGDWLETLLYILLGMSGLGGMAKGAHFLYKAKPGAI